jgi:hypothetical protein
MRLRGTGKTNVKMTAGAGAFLVLLGPSFAHAEASAQEYAVCFYKTVDLFAPPGKPIGVVEVAGPTPVRLGTTDVQVRLEWHGYARQHGAKPGNEGCDVYDSREVAEHSASRLINLRFAGIHQKSAFRSVYAMTNQPSSASR